MPNETFLHGVLNLCLTNKGNAIVSDLTQLHNYKVDVACIQEREGATARAAFSRFRTLYPEFGAYVPLGAAGAVPIVWRKATFRSGGWGRKRRTHKGRRGVSPNRYVTWKPLVHKATGRRVVVLNTHCVSGYTTAKPDQAWRDAAARAHWHAVAQVTRELQATGRYHAILLGGDFNAHLADHREPWYPGPALAGLYDTTREPQRTIMNLVSSRGSRVGQVARTRLDVNSDHPLGLRRLSLPA